MSTDKRTYTLNAKQTRLLSLLYKFRFANTLLLTEYLRLKSNSIIRNLTILKEQGYLGYLYDKSWKIDRRPAIYYLEKKALGLLKGNPNLAPNVLHAYYKNKGLSTEAKQHHLDVFAVFNALYASYADSFDMFTKSELSHFEEFPGDKPDLYLRASAVSREYLIILAHDSQPFITRKRLIKYIEHSEEEGWPTGVYPGLLFVLKTKAHERQFRDYVEKTLESAGLSSDELQIATTTYDTLTQQPYDSTAWTFIGDKTPSRLV